MMEAKGPIADDADTPLSYHSDTHGVAVPESERTIKVGDAIEIIGFGKFQRRVLGAAGLCFAADATEVMLLSFLALTLQSEWGLTPNQTATITSCVFAGALVGTLTLGYVGDRYGRRPAYLLSSAIISLFGALTAFSTGYASLVGIRFMVGFGVGGLTVPFDIYAEFLPSSKRGGHLLIIEYFWTAGSLMTPLLAYLTLDVSWRLFVILCAVPVRILSSSVSSQFRSSIYVCCSFQWLNLSTKCMISGVLGLCLVPESPRWLVSVGQGERALAVIRNAAAVNGVDPDIVFHGMKLQEEHAEEAGICTLFSRKWRRISFLLALTWMGFALSYYGSILAVTRIFDVDAGEGAEANGGTPNFDYRAIFISASAEVLGLTVVVLTVDSVGRIPTLVLSFLCGGICFFALTMSVGIINNNVLIVLAFCGRAFEMMGNVVTWVSTAEILTTEIRTTGHSAANAMGRTGAFFAPYLVGTNNSIQTVGAAMLVIHLITACCAYQLPEMKGRDLGHTSLDDNDEVDGALHTTLTQDYVKM